MNNLLILFIFVPILTLILLLLNLLLAPHIPDESKVSPYECGFLSLPGQTRSIFHIHFYIVALLFLIFDLEILLLLPVAVSLYHISTYGFSVALIFFLVLTVGFILEIGSGAVKLTDVKKESGQIKTNNSNPLPSNESITKGKGGHLADSHPLKTLQHNSSLLRINAENPKSKTHKGTARISTSSKVCVKKDVNNTPSNVESVPVNNLDKDKISMQNSKKLTHWEKVNEKDIGQNTENPHLIAKRHFASKNRTNAKVINSVQSKLGLNHTLT
jgi:NADH:ubiquinone oxidoreductase subunit 3 (subunit A)